MNTNKKESDLVSLKGKIALITGGASGIGLGAAKLLADAGAQIALIDIDESKGEMAAEEITKSGGKAKFYRCDVTSGADCEKTVFTVISDFRKIDILFNNAGVIIRKNTVDLSEKEWDHVLNVNLKAIYLMCHRVIPHMIENGAGSIINTGSGWGLKGGSNAVAYCASKGGVVNLTRAMAIDHGKHNIRVNCICPGDVDTPLLLDEAAQLGQDETEFLKQAADRPLSRIGQPKDVANAVLYLAGDLSKWVTGSILVVDGGGLA